ncbi:PREDICTED: U-box domain-containing [Prunus dulcis]|uniref:RING-type E3 ubiquitin transferase n=1 Tax=Prunus dulcis TaxID=3755 RepID=A0A5E4EVP4_PRUDU|nr:PREDICTED: U-box domain-containing [Prunus dulcis]
MGIRRQAEKREEAVALAIDKDRGSEYAIKWIAEHLLTRPGQSLTLVHVKQPTAAPALPNKSKSGELPREVAKMNKYQVDAEAKDLFLPFRCFCTKKAIHWNEVILENADISKALINYVTANSIEILVLGAPSRNAFGFLRFKTRDIPSAVSKGAPDFCTVYVICRGKITHSRPATGRLTPKPPLHNQIQQQPSQVYELDNRSSTSSHSGINFIDMSSGRNEFSSSSIESGRSWSSTSRDEMENEMRRLRLELKQTMEMYSMACKEAVTAKHKEKELHQWKLKGECRIEEARQAEESAFALAQKEKLKSRAAIEAAKAAERIAQLETEKRRKAEMKALRKDEGRKKSLDGLRYRKYTIEDIEAATNEFSPARKIGEGGYGPVFRGELDHTPVAIKVLRPDAAQGRSQFQKEVEVLSCIRHPNMVLLVGACPEYGCLVYEYMAKGSLEDRLFQQGNTPVIPWQLRFRIAAEIGTGLLFLHQTKPEPVVHRDLKPGNILLDHNYVSKISDVGLARLVPASVANCVSQYRITSMAGTFCYIDPEYQTTGMLGTKSDIFSLGVLLLQLITARPPMGLAHLVEKAIENGTFTEMLDPAVSDWPVEEAFKFAKLALQCTEMRRKDRPDLAKVVLPELNRLREIAEDCMNPFMLGGNGALSPIHDVMFDRHLSEYGYDSPRSPSSTSSYAGRLYR